MTPVTYLDALVKYFPSLSATSTGDGSVYENIIVQSGGSLPPKSVLDDYRLSMNRERKWREIQAERDMRRISGAPVGQYWFHSDDASRIQHLALVMMGENMPTGIMWKTMSGTFVEMTASLAQQIFTSISQRDVQIFAVAEQHRFAMEASENPRDYDFSANWPAIYGE
jgi:hypothetical protein